ncbi:transglycosylase SLT domain-containing protein [bacterium]|nr:transglycosylase SLT domain-containing protein [bacterium]
MLLKIFRCCFFLFILGMVAAIDLAANELTKEDSLAKITSVNNTDKSSDFAVTASQPNQVPFQPEKQNSELADDQFSSFKILDKSYFENYKDTPLIINQPEAAILIQEDGLRSKSDTKPTPSISDIDQDAAQYSDEDESQEPVFPKNFSQSDNQNEVDSFLNNLGRVFTENTDSSFETTAADYHQEAVVEFPVIEESEDTEISESDDLQKTLSEDKPSPNIPIYSNKRIQSFIHLYAVKKRDIFVTAVERSAVYMTMIQRVFKENDMPPNLAYLAVVESNLNPNARSRANAVGLWQFIGSTGKHFGLERSWWHDDRFDPEKSTVAAAKFLKQLHSRFDGNWELALAAYNSGGGTVRRAIRNAKKKGKPTDFWHLNLPRETRGYVPAFYAVATLFSNLDEHGFKPAPAWVEEKPKQILAVAGGISLKQIAEVLNVNHSILSDLNPSLRFRGLTPPTYDNYKIAVPDQINLTQPQISALEQLKENRHKSWKLHRIQQGDTLWSISRSYKVPIENILAYNQFKKKILLRIGQEILLPIPSDWSPPKEESKTELTKLALDKLPGVTYIHTVKKGDTLWNISQKYNIPMKTIRHWNRLNLHRRVLKIGTELILKLPVEVASKSM